MSKFISLEALERVASTHPRNVTADRYPTTALQQSLWSFEQLATDAPYAFYIFFAYRIDGALDVPAFQRALQRLACRHDALRTRLVVEDGRLLQVIDPVAQVELKQYDLTAAIDEELNRFARDRSLAQQNVELSLSKGPLFDLELLRLKEDAWLFHIAIHHAIADGGSLDILMRDLSAIYHNETVGTMLPPPPTRHIGDVGLEEAEQADATLTQETLDKIREMVCAADEPLPLAYAIPRPDRKTFSGSVLVHSIEPALFRLFRNVCTDLKTTPAVGLLALYEAAIASWSGSSRFQIGSIVSVRRKAWHFATVAPLVNPVVVPCSVDQEWTFAELLRTVENYWQESIATSHVSFEKVVASINPSRSTAYTPLFQLAYIYQNAYAPSYSFGSAMARGVPRALSFARYDLALEIEERSDGGADVVFQYSTDIFDQVTIERFATDIVACVERVCATPDTRVAQLTSGMYRPLAIAARFNDAPSRSVPLESSFGDLFSEAAARFSTRCALTDVAGNLTYAELDALSTKIGKALRDIGIKSGDVVALALPRSTAFIAGLVGILRIGAVYTPLQLSQPKVRLEAMLADSGAKVVICG